MIALKARSRSPNGASNCMNPIESEEGWTKALKLRIANAEIKIVTSRSSKGRGFMGRSLSEIRGAGEDNTEGEGAEHCAGKIWVGEGRDSSPPVAKRRSGPGGGFYLHG